MWIVQHSTPSTWLEKKLTSSWKKRLLKTFLLWLLGADQRASRRKKKTFPHGEYAKRKFGDAIIDVGGYGLRLNSEGFHPFHFLHASWECCSTFRGNFSKISANIPCNPDWEYTFALTSSFVNHFFSLPHPLQHFIFHLILVFFFHLFSLSKALCILNRAFKN